MKAKIKNILGEKVLVHLLKETLKNKKINKKLARVELEDDGNRVNLKLLYEEKTYGVCIHYGLNWLDTELLISYIRKSWILLKNIYYKKIDILACFKQ